MADGSPGRPNLSLRERAQSVLADLREQINRPFQILKPILPRGLFPRSLLIIVTPMVLLQLTVTLIFFERHYQLVTRRLSAGVAGDIAMLLSMYEADRSPAMIARLAGPARTAMALEISFLPDATLPPARPIGPFNALDGVIEKQLDLQISRPFWFDSRQEDRVDIRVALDGGVMQILTRRSRMLATNWHIFLVWMVLSSTALTAIAVLFLRNQVRAVVRLAQAAEAFGRGRDVPDFRPAGATEVRAAARALIDMRNRLSRHIDQRTDMLAGISHDMRTPLTRIKLQLELLEPTPDVEAIRGDIAEMEHMLEEYLAFARGEGSEDVEPTDVCVLLAEIAADAERKQRAVVLAIEAGDHEQLSAFPSRRGALRRCITNLVDNALTYARDVRLSLREAGHFLEIAIDDDGPGIPPEQYDEAFRPFRRLDAGLRSGVLGSGLGLAISRDLARSLGGDVYLSKSPMGGLRAAVRLPM
jgi:two-component system osmolarity sensor histidine kinase EnvZ